MLTPQRLVLTALLLTSSGCPDRSITKVEPHTDPQVSTTISVDRNRDLDLLFVIDNSGSMKDEQTSLVNEFPEFMATLGRIEGGLPNVHIAVVSSNVGTGRNSATDWGASCVGDGDDGLMQITPRQAGCTPPSGQFIIDVADVDNAGTRERNYSGTLEDTFKCIAELGTGGCGFEHHMESMRRALDGSRAENADFLRPGAYLAVVFIADEDDCSASNRQLFDPGDASLGPRGLRCTEWGVDCDGGHLPRAAGSYRECEPREDSPYVQHPRAYAEFLRSLKPGRPDLILLGGIFGPTAEFAIGGSGDTLHLLPSCGSDPSAEGGDGAVPPIRFRGLFEEFPDQSIMTSICDASLSNALTTIAEKFKGRFTSCLPQGVDLSDLREDLPGIQPDCSVSQRERSDGTEFAIGRCRLLDQPGPAAVDPASPRPCWYVRENSDCGHSGESGFELLVERASDASVDADLIVNCVGI